MSILGSIIPGLGAASSLYSAYSGYKANEENLKFAKQTRDIMVNQANTTFQRGYKDMMAAGLNPMLMGKVGGDPTPSLPSSAGQSAVPDVSSGLTSAYTANSARSLQKAQALSASSDARLKSANAMAASGLPAVQRAQIANLAAQGAAAQTSAQANMIQASSNAGVNKAKIPLITAQLSGQNYQNQLLIQQHEIQEPEASMSGFQQYMLQHSSPVWKKKLMQGMAFRSQFENYDPFSQTSAKVFGSLK